MMKRKTVAVLLVMAMAVSAFSGCGSQERQTDMAPEETAMETGFEGGVKRKMPKQRQK